jgi:hypothetical protein
MCFVKDDRTPEQRKTHQYLIVGNDSFLSGWGEARGGTSVAAWACEGYEAAKKTLRWVKSRGDMKYVRETYDSPSRRYRARNAKHVHIYVVDDNHRALFCEP